MNNMAIKGFVIKREFKTVSHLTESANTQKEVGSDIPLRLLMHRISKFLSRLSSRKSKSSGIVCSANLANRISI